MERACQDPSFKPFFLTRSVLVIGLFQYFCDGTCIQLLSYQFNCECLTMKMQHFPALWVPITQRPSSYTPPLELFVVLSYITYNFFSSRSSQQKVWAPLRQMFTNLLISEFRFLTHAKIKISESKILQRKLSGCSEHKLCVFIFTVPKRSLSKYICLLF